MAPFLILQIYKSVYEGLMTDREKRRVNPVGCAKNKKTLDRFLFSFITDGRNLKKEYSLERIPIKSGVLLIKMQIYILK